MSERIQELADVYAFLFEQLVIDYSLIESGPWSGALTPTSALVKAKLVREGLNATARIILLGLAMDVIYQLLVLKTFYPNEALVVALLLAFVPYVIIRGLVLRIARSRIRSSRGEGTDMNRQQ